MERKPGALYNLWGGRGEGRTVEDREGKRKRERGQEKDI
jgi:hypothetical protein